MKKFFFLLFLCISSVNALDALKAPDAEELKRFHEIIINNYKNFKQSWRGSGASDATAQDEIVKSMRQEDKYKGDNIRPCVAFLDYMERWAKDQDECSLQDIIKMRRTLLRGVHSGGLNLKAKKLNSAERAEVVKLAQTDGVETATWLLVHGEEDVKRDFLNPQSPLWTQLYQENTNDIKDSRLQKHLNTLVFISRETALNAVRRHMELTKQDKYKYLLKSSGLPYRVNSFHTPGEILKPQESWSKAVVSWWRFSNLVFDMFRNGFEINLLKPSSESRDGFSGNIATKLWPLLGNIQETYYPKDKSAMEELKRAKKSWKIEAERAEEDLDASEGGADEGTIAGGATMDETVSHEAVQSKIENIKNLLQGREGASFVLPVIYEAERIFGLKVTEKNIRNTFDIKRFNGNIEENLSPFAKVILGWDKFKNLFKKEANRTTFGINNLLINGLMNEITQQTNLSQQILENMVPLAFMAATPSLLATTPSYGEMLEDIFNHIKATWNTPEGQKNALLVFGLGFPESYRNLKAKKSDAGINQLLDFLDASIVQSNNFVIKKEALSQVNRLMEMRKKSGHAPERVMAAFYALIESCFKKGDFNSLSVLTKSFTPDLESHQGYKKSQKIKDLIALGRAMPKAKTTEITEILSRKDLKSDFSCIDWAKASLDNLARWENLAPSGKERFSEKISETSVRGRLEAVAYLIHINVFGVAEVLFGKTPGLLDTVQRTGSQDDVILLADILLKLEKEFPQNMPILLDGWGGKPNLKDKRWSEVIKFLFTNDVNTFTAISMIERGIEGSSAKRIEKFPPLLIETVLQKVTQETYPQIFEAFKRAAHAICDRKLYNAEFSNEFFSFPIDLPAPVSIDIWKKAKAKNRLDFDGYVGYSKDLKVLGENEAAQKELNTAFTLAFKSEEEISFNSLMNVLKWPEEGLGNVQLSEENKGKLFALYLQKLRAKEENAFPGVVSVLKTMGDDDRKTSAIVKAFKENMEERLPFLDQTAYYGQALETLVRD